MRPLLKLSLLSLLISFSTLSVEAEVEENSKREKFGTAQAEEASAQERARLSSSFSADTESTSQIEGTKDLQNDLLLEALAEDEEEDLEAAPRRTRRSFSGGSGNAQQITLSR